MNTQKSSPKWVTLLIVGLIFFSPGFLQGCDSFGVHDEAPNSFEDQPISQLDTSKLRFDDLLSQARGEKTAIVAGKRRRDAAANEEPPTEEVTVPTVHLVIGLDEYAAADVTRRVISKYDVTRRVISKYGEDVQVKAELEDAINAVTLEVSESVLNSLLTDLEQEPDVAWVEPDIVMPDINNRSQNNASSTQLLPWGVAQVGGALDSQEASSVQVFILDSGVTDTDELNLVSSVDFVGFYDSRTGQYQSYEKLPEGREIRDRIGHGSPIAGTIGALNNNEGIRGVAPGVAINSVKVLGKDGGTDVTTLLLALEYIMQQKAAMPKNPFVVNLSLGADIGTSDYNAVDEAVANAIEAGIVFVVAAGNEGIDASTVSPAHVTGAITVGSFGRDGAYSSFSNYGSVVDILAPGEDITSISGTYEMQGYLVVASGTSHAAPHVTGAAALYLATNPDATPGEVERALKMSAQSVVSSPPLNTTDKSVYADF